MPASQDRWCMQWLFAADTTQAGRDVNDTSNNWKKKKRKKEKRVGFNMQQQLIGEKMSGNAPCLHGKVQRDIFRDFWSLKRSKSPAMFTDVKLFDESRLQCQISHRRKWKWPSFTTGALFSDRGGSSSSRLKFVTTSMSLDKLPYKTPNLLQS